jgi:prepilin-type N-terminal cleavage/methylation domain-containing protein
MSNRLFQVSNFQEEKGFTMAEVLVATVVMVIFVVGALTLYINSHKTSVDQQQLAQMQHDARSAMFFISRDVRSTGVGLPIEFAGYFLEGVDNEDQGGDVRPDRLKILGNIEEPLNLPISNYQGASATISIDDYSFEKYPYNADAGKDNFYSGKIVMVLPDPSSGCLNAEIREITQVRHSAGGTEEGFNFAPGLAPGINPPQGLLGTCPESDDYDGGIITFINVKEYWLDVTGNYPGLNAGEDGYIGNGEGGILYLTENGIHYPLARNIENLQFQYNGDWNDDGTLDGFTDWQSTWTLTDIAKIRQVRIWVLGRTENRFISVTGQTNNMFYNRPTIANSPSAFTNDNRRRFLLETTVNIRNLSLDIYNQQS